MLKTMQLRSCDNGKGKCPDCEREGQTEKKRKVYGTWYSQAVTHPSTNQARRCLTSVIRRELVLSTWYGRRHQQYVRQPLWVKRWSESACVWKGLCARIVFGISSRLEYRDFSFLFSLRAVIVDLMVQLLIFLVLISRIKTFFRGLAISPRTFNFNLSCHYSLLTGSKAL